MRPKKSFPMTIFSRRNSLVIFSLQLLHFQQILCDSQNLLSQELCERVKAETGKDCQ